MKNNQNQLIWEAYQSINESDEFKNWSEYLVSDTDKMHPEIQQLITKYRQNQLPYDYTFLYCIWTPEAQYGCESSLRAAQSRASKMSNAFIVRSDKINDRFIKRTILKGATSTDIDQLKQ